MTVVTGSDPVYQRASWALGLAPLSPTSESRYTIERPASGRMVDP